LSSDVEVVVIVVLALVPWVSSLCSANVVTANVPFMLFWPLCHLCSFGPGSVVVVPAFVPPCFREFLHRACSGSTTS